MIVADGGQADGHHLGPEKCRSDRSEMVVRIGGEAGTTRTRQGSFATLRDAGVTLTGVPERDGRSVAQRERSTRPTGAIFRTLARLDPSVALVTTMHPTVLALWLEAPVEPPSDPTPGASSVTMC